MKMVMVYDSHVTDRNNYFIALASLFDEDFAIEWIEELVEMKASELLKAIDEAIESNLLIRKKPGFYYFKDLKKRQVLRDSLPQEERERLHRLISRIMLREIPDDPSATKAAANQLLSISNDLEGCRILYRAGDLYRKKHLPEKAFQCYGKIIQDLKNAHNKSADSLFIDTAISYSKVYSTAPSEIDSAIIILQEALVRAKQKNDKAKTALIMMHLAKNQWLCGQYKLALENYNQGWELAKDICDPIFQRSINTFNTFFHYWYGRFRDAVNSYEKLIPDVEKYPQRKLPLMVPATIGVCYGHIGQYSQGLGMLNATRSYCQEIGDVDIACLAGLSAGSILIYMGRISEAIQCIDEALEDEERTSDWVKCWRIYTLAYVHFLSKNTEKSFEYLKEYLKFHREKRFNTEYLPYLLYICWAIEQERYPKLDGLSLESEMNKALKAPNVYTKGVAYRYKALLSCREGQSHEQIMESFNHSLTFLQASGHEIEMARTKMELGRFYLNLGEKGKAREMINNAARILLPINETLIPDDLISMVKNLRKKDNLLEEIFRFGQEITSIIDHKALAQHIISAVNRITGAERGAIFFVDNDTDPPKITLKATRNITVEEINRSSFKRSMGLVYESAKTGKTIIHEMDIVKNNNSFFDNTIRSCICVPMTLRDEVIGILYNDNSMLHNAFKKTDPQIISYFTAQAAIALKNASYYDDLQKLNQKLKEEKEYYEELHTKPYCSNEFIGKSPVIKKVFDHITRVSNTNTTVLILGETGVGKEMVARAIHKNSPRCDKPFISVHCSALPKELISSELFGHEKGAFSGAIGRRIGRFELADGGTLFLDEIGDIPPEVQVRLLRILQSKEFERVGGEKTLHTDFRLLAATNRDLSKEVREKKFREDLYYRINVFPIYVPPLRQRKEDIPLLAQHFVKIYAAQVGKPIKNIPEQIMDKLLNYDWPGNVRELMNIIERGIILSTGPIFTLPELDISLREYSSHEAITTLEENERNLILRALKQTNGKIRGRGGAAELLAINYSTLYSRMKKQGIKKSQGFKVIEK